MTETCSGAPRVPGEQGEYTREARHDGGAGGSNIRASLT